MSLKNKKSNKELAKIDQNLPDQKEGIEEVVAHLKENPKFKDFSDDQLKIVAEVCIYEKTEIFSQSEYSGPLPHPITFEGYEKTIPGSANRIIIMAEDNAKNRIDLNKKLVEADIFRSNRGQILGRK